MYRLALFVLALALVIGCEDKKKLSVEKARQHAELVAGAVQGDVEEVKKGLPEGAKQLAALYERPSPPQDDLKEVREALERARNKVQDLRVAKSTFFALVDANGVVLRNDQEQDLMAGKSMFAPFPELKKALEGQYVETRGSMPEAAGVRGKPDGQWVAAQPISSGGKTKGLYVTGWSWAAYAYRLENAARSAVRSEIGQTGKEPLVYVYVLVADEVFGTPISPEVNAKAIADLKPLAKLGADGAFSTGFEITGRDFGLAVRATPALGPNTAIAVLRSET